MPTASSSSSSSTLRRVRGRNEVMVVMRWGWRSVAVVGAGVVGRLGVLGVVEGVAVLDGEVSDGIGERRAAGAAAGLLASGRRSAAVRRSVTSASASAAEDWLMVALTRSRK